MARRAGGDAAFNPHLDDQLLEQCFALTRRAVAHRVADRLLGVTDDLRAGHFDGLRGVVQLGELAGSSVNRDSNAATRVANLVSGRRSVSTAVK